MKIKSVLASLRAMLTRNTAEIEAAHARITLLTQRLSHVEQYTGMREHKFPPREQRWHFNQLQTDVKHGRTPRERASLRVA